MSVFEDKVVKAHEEQGWIVLRSGWPDFLMFKKVEGKIEIRVAEVKSKEDGLRENQISLLDVLSLLVPTYLIEEGTGHGDYLHRSDMRVLTYRVDDDTIGKVLTRMREVQESNDGRQLEA